MPNNILLHNRHGYTPVQADVLAFLVRLAPFELQPAMVDLPIKDLAKRTGRSYSLAELRAAVDVLGSRMYTERGAELRYFWLFQTCEFLRGTGILRVWVSPSALVHLADLHKAYSFVTLSTLLQLTSQYARRLYLLCLHWRTGVVTLPLVEFQQLLGLADEHGPTKLLQVSHLRQKVLAPAIQQLRRVAPLSLDYDFIRMGRSYHTIVLTIR